MRGWGAHGLTHGMLAFPSSVDYFSVYPHISVCRSGIVVERMGRVLVVNLQAGMVCNVPYITKFVVHFPCIILDVYCYIRRLQHLHVELLWEGTYKEGTDCVPTRYFIWHPYLFGFVSILQIKHT